MEGSEYEELRERVLRRDGWRCEFCGTMTNLEVHHQQFRSHAGEDTEQNLITLCASRDSLMHSMVHAKSDPRTVTLVSRPAVLIKPPVNYSPMGKVPSSAGVRRLE